MPNYQIRPKLWWDSDYLPEHRTMTIHESREPKDTGLVDAAGHTIYRMPEPIGFRLVPSERSSKEHHRKAKTTTG